MDLAGKKVIVTGGVRGLGRAMVEQLVGRDARVTVFDVDAAGLDGLRARHAGVQGAVCDVADYEQVVAATRSYHAASGAPDVLINNAGLLYSAPLVAITSEGVTRHDVAMWHRVLTADLSSVFYMTSCVVEQMMVARTRGVVVNISSVSAAGNAGQSAYSAAKAGVNALTATWAKELGPLGIRVLAVAPGFVGLDSTRAAVSESVLRETIKRVPLRRLGTPEEVAAGVLCVIENDFVAGKVFELDGGLTL
jgi:3-oxoacyl-[acyl-carrier protein] reductase